jgi:hypothetical protein
VPKTTGGSKEMFSKKPLRRDLIRAQVFLCLSDYRSKNEELIKPTKQNKAKQNEQSFNKNRQFKLHGLPTMAKN